MSVKSNLLNIAAAAPKALSEALDETADFILTLIRLYVPVRTGALKASYRTERVSPLHLIIGSALNYSVFVEYGTSRMGAQPHFTPAFLQAEQFLQAKIREKMASL